MATQTIQFAFLTGQTVTAKLFADDGSDTVLATPTATEATNRTGIYSFTQTDRAAGTYLLTVSATGINAAYTVQLTLATATFWAHERTHANVTQFGGTAGTFSSGRPEVNTTHVGGTSQTARDLGASVLLSNGTGTGQIKLSSGYVSPNWGDVANPTTTVGLTGTTISSSQGIASVSGAVGSVTSAVTLPTIPVDWITASGLAASAVSEITGGVSAELPPLIADAVWDDAEADHQTAGSMGAAQSRTTAIKAKTDNLPADPADASDIAASFITVNTKLDAIDDYVDTEVAAIKVVTDRLSDMLVQDGAVYQYTTNALERAPSGGSGGTVAVYPLNATMPARVYDLNITFYKNEDGTVVGPIAVTSRNANVFEPVDLSGRTLSVRFVDYTGTELLTVDSGDITVSGADNNQISFPVTSAVTGEVTESPQDQWHIWTLHDLTSGDNVLIGGKARVLLC